MFHFVAFRCDWKMHPVLIASLAAGGATIISSATGEDYWYDYWHRYVVFPEEYTNIIDELVSDPRYGIMNKIRIVSGTKTVPDEGVHYYYHQTKNARSWYDREFVGLIKIKEENDGKISWHYMCFVSPFSWGETSLEAFQKRIFVPSGDTVRAISIDMSDMTPKPMFLTKLCGAPRTRQRDIIRMIMNHWTQKNNYNTKVMVCGTSGLGKTYTGMLLKKHIDKNIQNVNVRLFDDFDPSGVGVNIRKLALKDASAGTPIIIVINEADIVYGKVVDSSPSFDPREQHTRDKTTFNNMMDAIASTKHVITIFTTERSPQELYANKEWRSFMRPGRIDFFANMTERHSHLIENNPDLLDAGIKQTDDPIDDARSI